MNQQIRYSFLALTLLLAGLAGAASTLSAADSVDVIVARFVKAIGGEEEIKAHRSVRVRGRWDMPERNLFGAFELLRAAPNQQLLTVELGPVGQMRNGYDGKIGWSISPMTDPIILEGDALLQAADDAEFYSTLHERREFESGKNMGKTKFDGRTCHEIRWVKKSGLELTEFYDAKSGLLAGNRMSKVNAGTATEVTLAFRDYQRFGKLLHATKVFVSSPPITQVLTITDVVYDDVSPSAFDLPPEIRALVK